MAQQTAIKIRRSATASKIPLTTDLVLGELALNTYDGVLYFKKSPSGVDSIVAVATLDGTQTLTNKTLTSPTINSGALSGTFTGSTTLSGVITLSNATDATSTTAAGTIVSGGLAVAKTIYADQIRLLNNGAGTNIYVGDDAIIGDINTADTMSVRGQQNAANGYIVFGNANSTASIGRSGSNPITVSGGQLTVTGTVTGSSAVALQLNGYANKGGVGYHDFLSVTNAYGSATNPNKFFRLNSTGSLEIINSAYTTNIFTLSDAGQLTVSSLVINGGSITAGGSTGSSGQILSSTGTGVQWITSSAGSSGTVTSVSVTSANGFAGTVANNTTTPAITISTSITGVLKGNGTAISAATAGTDYSAGTSALTTGILKSTTTTGALTIAVAADINSTFGSQTQNYVYAAPNGSAGTPTFRALVAADVPTLNQNTTGYAAGLAGGAIGYIPYQSAANTTLFVTGNTTTTPQFLTSTGTGSAAQAPTLTSSTGSGNVVLATSPTIAGGAHTGITNLAVRDTSAAFDVTLAAASSTTLTAGRTLTLDLVNAARTLKLGGNLTLAGDLITSGANSLTLTTTGATNVTLPTTGTLATTGSLSQFASTTSVQLATVISDETGTGSLVFGTSPTISLPTIDNIKMGYTTTATAAGTTTLTASSNYRQFFTGATTQTVVLPVTSTLTVGTAWEIENNSTGLLTVNSSGGNLVGTIPAGACAHVVCIGTALTTAADWDWDYTSFSTITGTGANVLGTSPTISGGSITALSTLAVRDTSAAFDVTLAATSSTTLTAGRTLTLDLVNAARTLKLGGNLTLAADFITSGANSLTLTTTGATNVTLPTTGTLATTTSTFTSGAIWNGNVIGPAYGGTGVANNAASTLTISGNFGTTFTVTNTTALTLPTSGTLTTTSNNLSVFAATTSAQLAGVISDETGSGALVFGTAPTFSTSIDGSATFTAFATPTNVNEFSAATSLTIGGTPSAQTITIGGGSTAASTYNLGTGATASATTKTVNLGTGGLTGSTTNVNIGSSAGGTTTVNNNLVVTGTFTVNGSTETINATTIQVADKNIELGKVASPTDTTADGGGITLLGATNKSIVWDSANNNWTSSENWNIPTGKTFKINNVSVLSATALGSNVTGSSLTSVGTITSGTWNGSVVGPAYGGTGIANNAASTLTISGNFGTTLTVSGTTSVTLPTTGTLATLAGSETLTNKTISFGSNSITTTLAQLNTAITDDDVASVTHKYHSFTNNTYYYDSYQQDRYFRLFTENAQFDNARFAPIGVVEYYDQTSSAWVTWSGGASTIQNLFDGRHESYVDIDHTHRKFRFTITKNSGWPTGCLIAWYWTWFGNGWTPFTTTIEDSADLVTWTTKETLTFGNTTNTNTDYGWHAFYSPNLHNGRTLTRITVDITDWTDQPYYTAKRLNSFCMFSNYDGATGTVGVPVTWDYNKNIYTKAGLATADDANGILALGRYNSSDTNAYVDSYNASGMYLRVGYNPVIRLAKTTNSVNFLQIQGSVTGSAPSISSVGSDSNIDLYLSAKGTGKTTIGNSSGLQLLGTTGSTVLIASTTASGTLTLPATTDTLVGKATTDTLTNKTLSSAVITGTITANGSVGTSGYVLSSTGTGVQWVAQSGGGGSAVQYTSQTLTTGQQDQARSNIYAASPDDAIIYSMIF